MRYNEDFLIAYSLSPLQIENQGFLLKKRKITDAYLQRWFVLKGNFLFYFKTPKGNDPPIGFIFLSECVVETLMGKTHGFQIISTGKVYQLMAPTEDAKIEWIEKLTRATKFSSLLIEHFSLHSKLAKLDKFSVECTCSHSNHQHNDSMCSENTDEVANFDFDNSFDLLSQNEIDNSNSNNNYNNNNLNDNNNLNNNNNSRSNSNNFGDNYNDNDNNDNEICLSLKAKIGSDIKQNDQANSQGEMFNIKGSENDQQQQQQQKQRSVQSENNLNDSSTDLSSSPFRKRVSSTQKGLDKSSRNRIREKKLLLLQQQQQLQQEQPSSLPSSSSTESASPASSSRLMKSVSASALKNNTDDGFSALATRTSSSQLKSQKSLNSTTTTIAKDGFNLRSIEESLDSDFTFSTTFASDCTTTSTAISKTTTSTITTTDAVSILRDSNDIDATTAINPTDTPATETETETETETSIVHNTTIFTTAPTSSTLAISENDGPPPLTPSMMMGEATMRKPSLNNRFSLNNLSSSFREHEPWCLKNTIYRSDRITCSYCGETF